MPREKGCDGVLETGRLPKQFLASDFCPGTKSAQQGLFWSLPSSLSMGEALHWGVIGNIGTTCEDAHRAGAEDTP